MAKARLAEIMAFIAVIPEARRDAPGHSGNGDGAAGKFTSR